MTTAVLTRPTLLTIDPLQGGSADCVHSHLMRTIAVLRSRSTDHLMPATARRRAALIDELERYADARRYPVNPFATGQVPVFIDENGNRCAVGHLLIESGYDDVAYEIAATQRFAYLADIDHPALPAWAAQHGFTLNELAAIQPTYDFAAPPLALISTAGFAWLSAAAYLVALGFLVRTTRTSRARAAVALVGITLLTAAYVLIIKGRILNPISPDMVFFHPPRVENFTYRPFSQLLVSVTIGLALTAGVRHRRWKSAALGGRDVVNAQM